MGCDDHWHLQRSSSSSSELARVEASVKVGVRTRSMGYTARDAASGFKLWGGAGEKDKGRGVKGRSEGLW